MIGVHYGSVYKMKLEFLFLMLSLFVLVRCTVDLNIHQLQMVADHLEITECKKLVNALHQSKFELTKDTDGSEEPNKPCIGLLLQWDRTDGEGKSFDDLALRLGQIGRTDLSEKLSKSVYEEKADALDKAFLSDPFKKFVPKESLLLDDVKKKKKGVDKQEENGLAAWEIASITCGSIVAFCIVCYIIYYVFGDAIVRIVRNYAPSAVVKWFEMVYSTCAWQCKKTKKIYDKEVVGRRSESGARKKSLAELNRNLNCFLNNNSKDALHYFDEVMRNYRPKTRK